MPDATAAACGRISKDLRQNATTALSSPGATDLPVVALSALLSLADWLGRKRSSSGVNSCIPAKTEQSPPRRVTNPGFHASDPTWEKLTANQRQILLQALGRLLVRRLPASDGKEVRDDQS